MMANIKLVLMVLALVFTIFTRHQASCGQDCYVNKDILKRVHMNTVKIKEKYIAPRDLCHRIVGAQHMACICRVSRIYLDPPANW